MVETARPLLGAFNRTAGDWRRRTRLLGATLFPSLLVLLAVDDDPAMLELLRRIFPDHYEFIAARDGATAIELLDSRRVDLILLDINLTDMDGLTLLRHVRARDPVLPVMLVTAVDRARTAFDACRLGANDYVTKPFDPDDLVSRVHRVIQGARAVWDGVRNRTSSRPGILCIHGDIGTRAALSVTLGSGCHVKALPSLFPTVTQFRGAAPDVAIVQASALTRDSAYSMKALRHRVSAGSLIVITAKDGELLDCDAHHPAILLQEPVEFGALVGALTSLVHMPTLARLSSRTARVIQRVAEAYPTATVASLSQAARISAAHLSRTFHAEAGLSLKTFIMRVRIEAAKSLLRATTAKTADIAAAVGLYDAAHLSRMFARYGVGSPRHFRSRRAVID